jgi:hypothetical protein
MVKEEGVAEEYEDERLEANGMEKQAVHKTSETNEVPSNHT